jgi:hypothetical protein
LVQGASARGGAHRWSLVPRPDKQLTRPLIPSSSHAAHVVSWLLKLCGHPMQVFYLALASGLLCKAQDGSLYQYPVWSAQYGYSSHWEWNEYESSPTLATPQQSFVTAPTAISPIPAPATAPVSAPQMSGQTDVAEISTAHDYESDAADPSMNGDWWAWSGWDPSQPVPTWAEVPPPPKPAPAPEISRECSAVGAGGCLTSAGWY